MTLCLQDDPDYHFNDWSFSQLCQLAGVSKETLNRLSSKTAIKALEETFPRPSEGKPYQVLSTSDVVRSVHETAYTRLWNAELLDVIAEAAFESEVCQSTVSRHRPFSRFNSVRLNVETARVCKRIEIC